MHLSIKKLTAILLSLVLGVAAFAPDTAMSGNVPGIACKCCSLKRQLCPPASCCADRSSERAPLNPASTQPTRQVQLQAVATVSQTDIIFPNYASDNAGAPKLWALQSRTIPIFQRDCSYLI